MGRRKGFRHSRKAKLKMRNSHLGRKLTKKHKTAIGIGVQYAYRRNYRRR